LIIKTDNNVIARILEKLKAEKLSYNECLKKYPEFLKAYIAKSIQKQKIIIKVKLFM